MTQRRSEAVIAAIISGLTAVLADVRIERNKDIPQDIGNGLLIVRDGDPGDPDVILSPRSYTYNHAIGVEVIASTHERLDAILLQVDAWIETNRGLGGLTDWLDPTAPQTDGAEKSGTEHLPFALFDLTATYTVATPLS